MKNDLTCGVVRDLLPSYVEGLTAPETNAAVERHLSDCADCERLRAELASKDVPGAPEEVKEVDYLKKVRRRGRRRVMMAVAVTVLVLALGIVTKVFIIGEPIQVQDLNCTITDTTEKFLELRLYSNRSGILYRNLKTEKRDGIVSISGRQVPCSSDRSSEYRPLISLAGIHEIWVCGRLVWQDGIAISPQIADAYEAEALYVGDASAVGRAAQALGLSAYGNYTTELKTSTSPYRWTVRYAQTDRLTANAREALRQNGVLALAVIGNLEEFEVIYTDFAGTEQSFVITAAELDAALPELVAAYNAQSDDNIPIYGSVKEYAASCADLQQLAALAAFWAEAKN